MKNSSSPLMEMPTIAWFLLFLTIAQQSFAARSLSNAPPGQTDHDHAHLSISFSMPDVLSGKHPSSRPRTAKVNSHLPFSKPLGYFPPIGGIPFADLDPGPMAGLPSQTLDLEGISVSFPAVAALQELELGTVTTINEDVYEGSIYGSSFLGKAQGIYVASSEDGSSHMMAMTACFLSIGYRDCLRFFGVHRTDVVESHVAVIGGTGKYHSANGYGTVKTVNISSSTADVRSEEAYKLLLFKVYLG